MNHPQPQAETVAEYVDLMRKRRGLTWERLADELQVSNETLRRWAAKEWEPARLEHLRALVNVLDLDPTVVLDGLERVA